MKKLSLIFVVAITFFLTGSMTNCRCAKNPLIFNVTCSSFQRNCHGESIEMVATKLPEYSYIQIDIKISQLKLNSDITFTNLTALSINGNSSSVSTINCQNETGIVLRGIKDTITLKNLKLLSCRAQDTAENGNGEIKTFVSALSIVNCRNVELNNVVISRSKGLGLAILNHQGGTVNITLCVFEYNKLSQNDTYSNNKQLIGGGGVYLELSHFMPGFEHSPMTFKFVDCIFDNNTAFGSDTDYVYTNAVGEEYDGQGRGGGVNLILGPGLNNVNVLFIGCKFTDNHAFHGGGLAVKILGDVSEYTEHVTVEITDSIFEGNGKKSFVFGAGVYLTIFHDSDNKMVEDCHYILRNVTFYQNEAEHGGAVYFFSAKQESPNSNSLVFDKCTFKNNSAHLGSAVIFASNKFFSQSPGHPVIPMFHNCRFLENDVKSTIYHNHQRTHGIGTIYISEYNVLFREYNCFENNLGTGIYLVNGVIDFQHSDVHFINNHGVQGGALALIGSSYMIVGPHQYYFINNTALYQGGAIYILLNDKTDFTTSRKCFIQYVNNDKKVLNKDWTLNITFDNNRVSRSDINSGDAIYATSFLPCQIIDSVLTNLSKIFSQRSEYITFDGDLKTKLASDVDRLHKSDKQLTVIPGLPCQHGVSLEDDYGNVVRSPFRATLQPEKGEIKLARPNTLYVTNNITLIGSPGSTAILILQTLSTRETYIRLHVSLDNCPPGFKLRDDFECKCNHAAYIGIFGCSSYGQSFLLPGYWAGIFDTETGSVLVTSASPFHSEYTQPNDSQFKIILPTHFSDIEVDKLVCGKKRTGVACGRCRGEMTAYFHSPDFDCKEPEPIDCKLGWLFYILSELVPVTVLFITVLVLNISFTSGAVNGFVLFIQMFISFDIDASGIITFPEYAKYELHNAKAFYKVIYGFFDLDMFNFPDISFCLWKGASPINMIAFKYVTIVYSLLLIAVVIFMINKFGGRCLGKCCRITTIKVSVIRGISTFLILCYSQCIKISLGLLSPLHIHMSEDASNLTCSNCSVMRVWFDGNLRYFHEEHLPYALPAILCLLTVGIIPPVLLLAYPLLNKILLILSLENHLLVNKITRKIPVSRFMPFFDSFQSCFKDEMRFFAGLYFLYRWPIHLVYHVKSYDEYYAWVSGILVIIFTLHTICQPYIKKAHNIIDALLFADLVLINFLSYLNFQNMTSQRVRYGATVTPAIIQLVLIYLPLLVMLFYQLSVFLVWLSNFPKVTKVASQKMSVKLRRMINGMSSHRDSTSSSEEDMIHERLVGKLEYLEYKEE